MLNMYKKYRGMMRSYFDNKNLKKYLRNINKNTNYVHFGTRG